MRMKHTKDYCVERIERIAKLLEIRESEKIKTDLCDIAKQIRKWTNKYFAQF